MPGLVGPKRSLMNPRPGSNASHLDVFMLGLQAVSCGRNAWRLGSQTYARGARPWVVGVNRGLAQTCSSERRLSWALRSQAYAWGHHALGLGYRSYACLCLALQAYA